MFDTLKRSWTLYTVCWKVLRHDKELLLFPIISGISLVITLAVVFGSGLVDRLARSLEDQARLAGTDYLIMFLFYFINYFIIIYFNAALIGAARIRLQGGDPTLRDGFRTANANLLGITGWAAISAVVSLLFYALDKAARMRIGEQRGRGGSGAVIALMVLAVLSQIAQIAWSVITYLVIPVLVVEKVGPIQAIKRSAWLVKKTWGEQLVSRFGFDLMVILFSIPIVLLCVILAAVIPAPAGIFTAVAVGIVAMGLLILVTAALRAIYVAALYQYAATGTVPQVFPREMVVNRWEPKPRAAW